MAIGEVSGDSELVIVQQTANISSIMRSIVNRQSSNHQRITDHTS